MNSATPDFEETIDGCCLYIAPHEATADEDLPPTEGGVDAIQSNLEDDIDSCAIPIPTELVTPDEALPVAMGGIAE